MLDAPEHPEPFLPDGTAEPTQPQRRLGWLRDAQLTPTRRALLLTALGGLMIAGVITVLPDTAAGGRLAGLSSGAGGLSRANSTFDHASSGACLNWPDRVPDAAQIVDCTTEHRFEVAEAIDLKAFPGTEYGPNAAPPSPARIQQISQEQCQSAVQRYLGDKYDPNGRFAVSLLWSGEKAWRQNGERRMLCGLQLPGADNQQQAFQGKVAAVDQSKVWPAGTCLGIDPATNQPTDVPVDCASPHALEVTGAVNLAEKYPAGVPPEQEQDSYVKDTCAKVTDDYLAPLKLRTTTLTLVYSTISLPSWLAGSHQVSCSIGTTLGNGGWSTLLNSAKGALMINGRPPVPPPDIPDERLNMPAIPLPSIDLTQSQYSGSSDSSQSSQQTQSTQQTQSNQHLPGQTSQTSQTPATQSTQPSTAAPVPPGNTFLNGPPPPDQVGDQPVPAGPPLDGPPPPADAPAAPAPAGPAPGPAEPVLPPAPVQ
ncbi:septum formation family protein [Mycobacterium hackensackense]|uniref:septum formation family protein n=1 Tax=Mycobacterium hackensackense TaxID=228909 RepID=UPI002265F0B4|nr:septum formation family protein [Mycobacterium hackensackense]MCV7253613.1 septum formation family protein [Mycobacterium hackensackense]